MQPLAPVPGGTLTHFMARCARILVHPDRDVAISEARQLDMRPIAFAFRGGVIAVQLLADSVEAMSEQRLTVRRAESRLFADPPLGTKKINLGLCPFTKRLTPIQTMSDEITLFRIGGAIPGLIFEAAAGS